MKTLRQYPCGFLIPIVMLSAITIVALLALMAVPEGKTGFNRQFIVPSLSPIGVIKKDAAVTAFAGARGRQLYFATLTPIVAFVTDSDLVQGNILPTGFTVSHPKAQRSFELVVSDSNSTLFAGNLPAVFTRNATTIDSFNLTDHLYTRAVTIDSGYYVFRAYDPFNKKTRDQALVKVHPALGIIAMDTTIIPRLHDGGIGNEGMLHYDALNKQLLYVSYYSNKVYIINPQLQLIKVAHTIDTLSAQQEFAGEEKKDDRHTTLTNIKPKRIINADSYVHNGILYVHSKVKAENESNGNFTSHAVVDCYLLKDFTYTGSFYLPDYKGEKLWNMGIAGSSLLAISRSHIVRYALPNL